MDNKSAYLVVKNSIISGNSKFKYLKNEKIARMTDCGDEYVFTFYDSAKGGKFIHGGCISLNKNTGEFHIIDALDLIDNEKYDNGKMIDISEFEKDGD